MKLRLLGVFMVVVISVSSCASAKRNPVAGKYAGKQIAYKDPVSIKKKSVRKSFIIKDAETIYLGQICEK